MSAIEQRGDSVVIAVRVAPRGSRNEVCGLAGDAVKVRLTAPPVDGKANVALAKFLAMKLDISPGRISLIAGAKGRNKRVSVAGISAVEAGRRLDVVP
jgi:uncharacterized protein (TIGR00251 family)